MSPVEKIADWIKDKPIWWKHAVRLSLQNGELSQVDLDEIYNIARMEHGFLNEEDIYQLAKKPINTNGYGVESAEITLASISNVVNVGRLADDQHLSFLRKGLTIIYGDNGTGKSSYSRILKHACLARGSTPQILGNVFEKNTEKSSAVLSIHVDGNIETKHWNLDYTSDSNLKAIRVYDSAAADHFVTGEDELGYKPLGLKLLEDLSLAIDHVKGEVKKEVAPGYGMVVLPDFSDTKTSQFVKTLSHETDFFLLNEYIATEEEIINLDKLSKDIAELKVTTPTQLRTELNRKKQLLLPLKIFIINSALSLSDSIFEDLQFRRLDLDQKSQFAEQLRKKLLSGMPISGIGGNEWKVMWNAAEKFFLSTGDDKKFPPTQSENCPLCLQEVSDESSSKLAGFSEFMADQVSLQVKEAKEAYDLLRNKVSECILDISQHQVAISMADEAEHGFSNVFNGFINELNNRKLIFSSEDIPGKINPLTDKVITKIEIILQQIDASLLEISDDGSVAEVINMKEQLHREIIDKKLFKSNLHHIKTNINRFKEVKMYQELDAQCKSRSVTEINSDICRTQVIAPLVNSFDDELEKFGFSRFQVKLKTRGRSGAQLLKLEILDSGEPLVAKVASEGEQRCISIACFLAEMRADKRKSAVIFDDPVSSLSHQWSSRVAKRLVSESLNRQVIILTHDIVFYKLLLEEVEKLDTAIHKEICLERNRKKVGIVRSTPPWDALTTSARIKQLKVMLFELKKTDQQGTDREFRKEAYNFYGYLREAWERLVEEKLLNQVVTRFGRSVQTKRLKNLVDITVDDYNRIEAAMGKCSTYFRGHDSAPAVGDAYPTIEEIELDIKTISEFNDELKKKRNRN